MVENYQGVTQVTGERHIEDVEGRLVLNRKDVAKLNGATPSVRNVEVFQANNVAPVNVTDFLHGQVGQSIAVLGDGNMTIVHGTKIKTNTAANKLLATLVVYRFTLFDVSGTRTWIEDE